MPDPLLTLFNSDGSVANTNSGWGTPASNEAGVAAADATLDAFPLTDPTSKDAALLTSLPTNHTYTVQISSTGNHTGSVLAEVYDATANYAPGSPVLTNLSCLSDLAAEGLLTAGFTISGSTARTVLIRANGPTLSAFGLSPLLADPVLALHTSVSGQDTILASNAGWGGTA